MFPFTVSRLGILVGFFLIVMLSTGFFFEARHSPIPCVAQVNGAHTQLQVSTSTDPFTHTVALVEAIGVERKATLMGGDTDLSASELQLLQYNFARDFPLFKHIKTQPLYALGDRVTNHTSTQDDAIVRNMSVILQGAVAHAMHIGDIDTATYLTLTIFAANQRCPLPEAPYRLLNLLTAWEIGLDVIHDHPDIMNSQSPATRVIWWCIVRTDFVTALVRVLQEQIMTGDIVEPFDFPQGAIAPDILGFYEWWFLVLTERSTLKGAGICGELPDVSERLPKECAMMYESLIATYQAASSLDSYSRLASIAIVLENHHKHVGEYPIDPMLCELHGIRFRDPHSDSKITYTVQSDSFALSIDKCWPHGEQIAWRTSE